MEFETRVKDLILTLLDKPLTKMTIQEELMTKYSESLRRNIRRTQELEFTLQKYQRANSFVEAFDARFSELEKKLKEQAINYDEQFVKVNRHLHEEVHDQFKKHQTEIDSWKRWFAKI